MKNRQAGSSLIAVILAVVVIGMLGYTGFRIYENQTNKITEQNAEAKAQASKVKIKDIGFNLDYYDDATGMAGDIKFTKFVFPEGSFNAIYSEFGRKDLANSAKGNAGASNPQPTFLLPLGTKVRALIDGEVVKIPKLYSGDYSIHMQGKGSDLIFETEHVMNVKVKVGDNVKAGTVIAEVSDYNGDKLDGLGLLEIGVLITGKTPGHACTFDYLDDSIKAETLKKLRALEDSWEAYRGEPNAYQQDKEVIPGCLNRDIIYDNNTGGGK
jgi:biotin carboxyl carrier protein